MAGEDETKPTEGEPASEPAAEPAPADDAPAEGAPAEGEPKPEPTEDEKAAKAKEESEWEIKVKAAAEKYAADTLRKANAAAAAARRIEKSLDGVKTENVKLREDNKVYTEFVNELRTKPMFALGRLGFRTFREFAEYVAANGGDAKEPSDEDRIAALLDKKLEEREGPRRKAEAERAAQSLQTTLFAEIDKQKDTFTRTATKLGRSTLWSNVEAYARKHQIAVHAVPDEALAALAEEVEKDLRAEFGEPDSGRPAESKTGNQSDADPAAGASRSSGKTLAGRPTSGAPAPAKLPLDPEERRKAVNRLMREAGELRD